MSSTPDYISALAAFASAAQMAVRLAASGFTGPFDGPGTTFGMVLGDEFDPYAAIADLRTRWLALDGYLKLHPTARYAHSAIDALYNALPASVESWPRPDDIEHIDIRAYQLAAFLSAKVVKNAFGTRFSIPFALATIIHDRRSGIDCFDDDAIRIAAVQELAQRIDVSEDLALTALYPRQQRVDLRLALRDGRFFEGRCTITSGEPANPHPPRSLKRKFMSLSAPIWGEAGARALLDEYLALEQVSEMRAFPQSVTL